MQLREVNALTNQSAPIIARYRQTSRFPAFSLLTSDWLMHIFVNGSLIGFTKVIGKPLVILGS